jgi:tetratricopeptide (TPR) repeat protein
VTVADDIPAFRPQTSRRIRAANPQNDVAWANRGIVRKAKGDAAGAIGDFDQALKLNPSLTEVYRSRGVAYMLLGKPEEAERDFDTLRHP